MTATPLEALAMLCAAALAAAMLLAGSPRRRWPIAACGLAIAAAMILVSSWNSEQLLDVRSRPELATLFLAIAAAIVACLAWAGRRWPMVVPLAAVATVALRVPIPVGPDQVNLLVPLYLVIAAGVLERLTALARPGALEPRRYELRLDLEGALRVLLALSIVAYAVQATYSANVTQALESLGFFLVPFAALFCLLREIRWGAVVTGRALLVIAATGLAFALVAFVQYALRELQLNQELIDSNQIHAYFRVNSVFHDPNVLARYLALAVVALTTAIVCSRMARVQLAATVSSLALVGALAITFSLSGFVALAAGLGTLAVLGFGPRRAAIGAGAALALSVAFALVVQPTDGSGAQRDLDDATSGRASLAEGGLELFADRPLQGFGSGSFGAAFSERIEAQATTDSHTEPVTVAAEQGLVGLAVYVPLLGVSLLLLLRGAGPRFPARLAIAACYVALLVHTLAYAGYLSDALAWALLAIGASLAAGEAGPASRGRGPSARAREALG